PRIGTRGGRAEGAAEPGGGKVCGGSPPWRVEAGGIDPPSEWASPSASTSVAGDLSLAALAPIGRIARGQPAKDLGPRAAGVAGAQPEEMAPRPALRARAGEAWSPN